MATKYLSASASLSAAVWWTTSGGSTTTTAPTTGDDADLNAHTLTVDQTLTCDNVVGSGTLTISGNRTINANLGESAGTSTFAISTLNGGQTVTINGNVYPKGSAGSRITQTGGSNTLNITGTVYGGTTTSTPCISMQAGTLSITGDLTLVPLGNFGNIQALNTSGGTVTVTGNVYPGGSGGNGVFAIAGGTITVNGNITSGSTGACDISSGSLTVNGNVSASTSVKSNPGIFQSGGTVVVNGDVTGGLAGDTNQSANGSYGITLQLGTLTITGNLVDGGTLAVLKNNGTYHYTPTSGKTYSVGSDPKVMVQSGGGGGVVRVGFNGGFGG